MSLGFRIIADVFSHCNAIHVYIYIIRVVLSRMLFMMVFIKMYGVFSCQSMSSDVT